MQTDAQKIVGQLADVDTRLRRWETRLRRATNMVSKLSKKRRTLAVKLGQVPVKDGTVGAAMLDDRLDRALRPKTLADRSPRNDKGISGTISKTPMTPDVIPLPELDAFFAPERPRAHARIANLAEDLGPALREAGEDAGIPAFLDRRDPVVAERMTAARKKAEADERRKMPLTGRAALDAIKATRKKKKA